LVFAIVGVAVACSVYDESLRRGSGLTPLEGGDGAVLGGGAGTPSSGGTDSAAGGGSVDAGAPGHGGDSSEPAKGGSSNGGGAGNASGGRAGAASGGSGGAFASAGSAGTAVNGGSGGRAGNGGSGGAALNGGTGGMGGSLATAGSTFELALNKSSTASTAQPANPTTSGNDGQTSTRFSATSATLPQWWRVDLGASHALAQVAIQFEFPDRKYTYAVETSLDDVAYTSQANVTDGIGTVQTVAIPNHAAARYVRITVTSTVPGVDSSGASRPTWMSFWEVSVQGN